MSGPLPIFLLMANAVCAVAPPLPGGTRPPRLVLADVAEAFPEIDQKLAKGLTVTILHEVSRPGSDPLVFGCRVFYDLWDETYGVTTLLGETGTTRHAERDKKKLAALCNEANLDFPVAGLTSVAVTSRLDPVSADQLEKTREWLASRGIGTNSKAIVGRAVGAIINLKDETSISRTCKVEKP